jgi:hypothetical protein
MAYAGWPRAKERTEPEHDLRTGSARGNHWTRPQEEPGTKESAELRDWAAAEWSGESYEATRTEARPVLVLLAA